MQRCELFFLILTAISMTVYDLQNTTVSYTFFPLEVFRFSAIFFGPLSVCCHLCTKMKSADLMIQEIVLFFQTSNIDDSLSNHRHYASWPINKDQKYTYKL